MMTVKNPKTMKSYHSNAFPITTAGIWNGFDTDVFIEGSHLLSGDLSCWEQSHGRLQ